MLPVSIGLLLKLDNMCFGIGINTRVVLPYIAIVLVMLVCINILSFRFFLSSFDDREVQ